MIYYYGYDDRWYGPVQKSEIHETKDVRNAQKNAYRMVKEGWGTVCISNSPTYKRSAVTRIVGFDDDIGKMTVTVVSRKSRPIYVLRSDGTTRTA